MRQIKGPKTAKKSPRWRSGDACVTNPNSRKFRDQAKQNITSYQKESRQKGKLNLGPIITLSFPLVL